MESESRRRLMQILSIGAGISGFSYLLMFQNSFLSWVSRWFRWKPTSTELLLQAEEKILSYIQKPFNLSFLKIPSFSQIKDESNIRTLIIKNESTENTTPLVLLHGFASGVGLWILNLEKFSEKQTVYAIDILGFGNSSRPSFSKDAEAAENQLVESIELWRKQVGLENFILLGHSMGGFLAASYAIKYPNRVKHLILADAWGFPEPELTPQITLPFWIKCIGLLLRPFNPLAGLRAAGPWGPELVQRFRPDILGKFSHFVDDTSIISNYIYHCNAQTPSGEAAFKAMTAQFGWAKRPMIKRIADLHPEIPITFLYGSKSWINRDSGPKTAILRPNSSVEIKIIEGAGHHVYADRASEFNNLVCEICDKVHQSAYSSLSPSTKLFKKRMDYNVTVDLKEPILQLNT